MSVFRSAATPSGTAAAPPTLKSGRRQDGGLKEGRQMTELPSSPDHRSFKLGAGAVELLQFSLLLFGRQERIDQRITSNRLQRWVTEIVIAGGAEIFVAQ